MKESESKLPLYIGGMVILIGVLVLLAKESLFFVIGSIVLVLAIGFLFINRNKFARKMPGAKINKLMAIKLILIALLLLMGAVLFYRDYPFLAVLVFMAAIALFIIKDYRTVLVLIVLAWLSFVFFMGGFTWQALWDAISFPVEWAQTFGRGY